MISEAESSTKYKVEIQKTVQINQGTTSYPSTMKTTIKLDILLTKKI